MPPHAHDLPAPDSGLDRFAPPSLRRALRAAGAHPAVEVFDAALLFADVSGFTALAARMAARGLGAAEELSAHLNACFGETLRLVHGYGGEVEKFAGDALLAVFRAGPGSATNPSDNPAHADNAALRQATRLASDCAHAITRAIEGRPAGDVALGVHVGVGAGTLSGIHVDLSAGMRAFVLLGEPFAQMALAASQARSGEVCLSAQAQALLSDGGAIRAESAAVHGGPASAAALAPALDPGLLAPYLNRALRERLSAVGDATWIAELRRATVLFIHLGPVPAASATGGARIARLAQVIGTQVARFDGLLHDLLSDDKGLVAIVMFGVRQTHEDDAARGVRAALELHAALAMVDGAAPSIGVATGRVYCGVVGNQQRSELAVVGDAMNLAARLMGAAVGQVLCAPVTASEAGERFLFSDVTGIAPKGGAATVTALRLIGARQAAERASARPLTALLGREREWAGLLDRLAAHHARPAFDATLIEGEAGIGKSALVHAWADEARTRGLRVLRIAGTAIDQVAPYQACSGMVADLLGVDPDSPAAQQIAQISGRLSLLPEVAPLAPLLAALLPVAPPEDATLRALDAQARAQATRELLLALLASAASSSQSLLVVEDAHWLDSASWELLAQLAQRRLPLLLVVSTRPAAPDPLAPLDAFVRQTLAGRVVLGPLAETAAEALMCAKLGVARLTPAVRTLVHERAAGHPFFTEELTLALRDAGMLRVEGGVCVLASSVHNTAALAIPDTLERVLTSRIDSLGENQRLVLKVASVLGRTFSIDALAAVYPVVAERAALPAQLADLSARELLAPLDGQAYQFKHAITCEAGYALLPFAQRRDLHRAVALDIEQRHAGDLPRQAPLLAHHWGHAQVYDKALEAAVEAGTQALNRFANREAVHFFREALRFDGALAAGVAAARAAQWEVWLGRAHRALGEIPESRRNIEAALTRLSCPLPARRLPVRLRLARQLARMFLTRPGAAPRVAQADATTLAVDAYNQLATLSHYANDVEAMFFCTANASERARRAPASIEVATLYSSIAHMAAFGKLFGASRRYREAAKAVAAQVDTAFCTATVNQYTGHLAACLGDLDTFERDMHHALTLYAGAGKGRPWEEALVNLSYLYAFRGDLPRALDALQTLEHAGRARNDSQTAGWGMVGQGRVLLQQGQLREAVARFTAAEASTGDSLAWSELYGNRALAQLRLGLFAAAREDAGRALEIVEKTPSTSYTTLPGYAAAMETLVLLALEHPADGAVRAQVERMYRAFAKFAGQFPIASAQKGVWNGALAAVRGKPAGGRRMLERAVALARRSALRCDEPAALRWLARLQTGAARDATLLRAATLFEAIGYQFEAAQARAAIAGGPGEFMTSLEGVS